MTKLADVPGILQTALWQADFYCLCRLWLWLRDELRIHGIESDSPICEVQHVPRRDEGLMHRCRRPIEPEAVFAQIK